MDCACVWMLGALRLRGVSRLPEGITTTLGQPTRSRNGGMSCQGGREPAEGRYFVHSLGGSEEEQEDAIETDGIWQTYTYTTQTNVSSEIYFSAQTYILDMIPE